MRVLEKYIERKVGTSKFKVGLTYELELDGDPNFAHGFSTIPKTDSIDRKGRITIYIPAETMRDRASLVKQGEITYDAIINFKVVNAAGKPEEKALSVYYIWINDSAYQGMGLGSLLVYEIASVCLRDYRDITRFEIEGAVSDALGFYSKLGLHISSVFSKENMELPNTPPVLPPLPKISDHSLRAMTENNNTPWVRQEYPKFNRVELDYFHRALEDHLSWSTDMATSLLENSVENMLHTSKIQAIKAGWLI